jgi:hypothetical protein
MFHFPSFPPHTLCVQVWVTAHDDCRVSPFGNPRIKAWLTAPRGLSWPPTSFIGSWCQGIHRAPLKTWPQMLASTVQFSNNDRAFSVSRPNPQTPNSAPQYSQADVPPMSEHPRALGAGCCALLRKEVIQPHLPVRLPCYDFVPIAGPTFDGSPRKGWATGFGCYRLS